MPIFRSKDSRGATPPASTLSIIASGMRVVGDVSCDGVLRVDGTLEGSILGARQLLVTPGGRVRGDIEADEIVVGGTIDGNVRAAHRLELQGTAVVNGNIETRAFVVPEGGRVNGDIRMIDDGAGRRADPLRLAARSVVAEAPPPEVVEELPRPATDREVPQIDVTHLPLVEREPAPDQLIVSAPADAVEVVPPRKLSKRERRKQRREAQ